MIKRLIQWRLERYVRRYLQKHDTVKLIAVVGSVGKTSTKIAIGTVLSEQFRVRLHEGNHNAELSAPLAILGIEFPENLRDPRQWFQVFAAARERIKQPTDVDIIVQEVGTDRIGQVPHFGTYVTPFLTVVTAVSPEHMEYFGSLEAVAKEELSAVDYSQNALINRDDVAGEYAQLVKKDTFQTYGTTDAAEFHMTQNDMSIDAGVAATFFAPGGVTKEVTLRVVGEHSLRAVAAAGAVGQMLGMEIEKIASGMANIRPVSGRMQLLRGMNDTLIIDDTYNSSPLAAAAALRALYSLAAPQRIAVLGSMNELGDMSGAAHQELGNLCDPSELAHVITVGEQAEKFLAPAARTRGCHVVSFVSALEAGAAVHKLMEPGALLLFKGSEGQIFLEEAVKMVLHTTDDEAKLVRQSPAWMKRKQAFFDSVAPKIDTSE